VAAVRSWGIGPPPAGTTMARTEDVTPRVLS